MQNYAKTLELIQLNNEIAKRTFEVAIQSPFPLPVIPAANDQDPAWQPLLEYPEPAPK
jgi:hypothetical protein